MSSASRTSSVRRCVAIDQPTIASDDVFGDEAASILSRVTGLPIRYRSLPVVELRRTSVEHARMFEWLDAVGFGVDIHALHSKYRTVGWQSFEEWAERQRWRLNRLATETLAARRSARPATPLRRAV